MATTKAGKDIPPNPITPRPPAPKAQVAAKEFIASDGTVRQSHYGSGRQPWDDICDYTEWAPYFCAANVLKYMRRTKEPNHSRRSAKWYLARLQEFASGGNSYAQRALLTLNKLLTAAELERLE